MHDTVKIQPQNTKRDGAKWQRPEALQSTYSSGLTASEFSSDHRVSDFSRSYDDAGAFPLVSDSVLSQIHMKRSASQKKAAQWNRRAMRKPCASTGLDYETVAAACATSGVSSRPLSFSRQAPKQRGERSWHTAHSTSTSWLPAREKEMIRATSDNMLTSATNSIFPEKRLFETHLLFRERADALTRPQNIPSSSENFVHPDRQSHMLVDIDSSFPSVPFIHPDRQSHMLVDINSSSTVPFIHPDLRFLVLPESDSTQLQIKSKPLETASISKTLVKTDVLRDDIDEFHLASALVKRPKEQSPVVKQNWEESLLSFGIENHAPFSSKEDTEVVMVEGELNLVML